VVAEVEVGPHCAGFGGADEEEEKEDGEDDEFYGDGGDSAEFAASVDGVGAVMTGTA